MSSAVVSTSAALGRPFVFDPEAPPEFVPAYPEKGHPPQRVPDSARDPRLANVTSASRLNVRPAPEMASSGIAELDVLTGGLPRGCLTEICGPASSGRTTVMLAALATSTRRGEFCVVVDASDSLDPQSVADAGVDLDRLLWVRCGESSLQKPHTKTGAGPKISKQKQDKTQHSSIAFHSEAFQFDKSELRKSENCLEQVLRTTDLLLESGGFGVIVLDLGNLPEQTARRIPLTTWFRFRRAVEYKPTVLLAIENQPIAGSCSSLLLKLGSEREAVTFQHICAPEALTSADAPADNASEARNLLTVGNELAASISEKPAANQRKNAVHGAIRGSAIQRDAAREGQNKINPPTHSQLLTSLPITIELMCSRLERKPARATHAAFTSTTAWAG
jgi:recombination protein RecA